MRILVDSNIFASLAQPAHTHHEIARTAVENVRARNDHLFIVPQIVYEFWVVATRSATCKKPGLGMSVPRAKNEIGILRRLFTFLNDKPGLFDEWRRLVVQYDVRGLPAHDTRIVAAMRLCGITHILTFNARDFRRYSEITALSPDQLTGVPGAG